MPLAIPAPVQYTDLERLWIDLEPPGLFSTDQDSYWGQRRKVYADYLQALVDDLAAWYLNMDPNTVDDSDIDAWENMLGIPVAAPSNTLEQRRAFVLSRWSRGPFTRTRRQQIVEQFISATFGAAVKFTPDGVIFGGSGIPFFSGADDLSGTYAITEDIPNFHYTVSILDTIDVDVAGLTRELARVTPAGITFSVTSLGAIGGYGVDTYGVATYQS